MTALPVILFQLTCHGNQRARGVQFQPTCKLCRESHKTQVWLFLVLSLLSTSTCVNSMQEQEALQDCLNQLKPAIEKSDAMLYAPAIQDFPDNCTNVVLNCYMLELMMVITEENITDGKQDCIFNFSGELRERLTNGTRCPACETYTLQNITTFLARLTDLLQKMKST